MTNKQLPVTDHAVMRYLERVAGIDIEAVRQRIYDQSSRALAQGASGVISNGIAYKIHHGKVRSVWIEHGHTQPLNWPNEESTDGESGR